ncbi:hypothetical protein ACP4OV_005355 [Aristida adscensionis]
MSYRNWILTHLSSQTASTRKHLARRLPLLQPNCVAKLLTMRMQFVEYLSAINIIYFEYDLQQRTDWVEKILSRDLLKLGEGATYEENTELDMKKHLNVLIGVILLGVSRGVLYKREKDKDVNLLEPMYSVELDAIQGVGGHTGKGPSGKRDFLIPVDEKHDYDWLKTPPATPLFPSLEMEANSSQMVFQKELPIPPRQVEPSASKVLGKPGASKPPAPSAPQTNKSPWKNNFAKGASTISNEKNQSYTVDKRSYTVPMNRQQKAASATTVSGSTPKKHSERCHGGHVKGSTNPEFPCKETKNPITIGSIFRRHTPSSERARIKDPASGADVKGENGKTRRQSCPPAVTRDIRELKLEGKPNVLPPRGKMVVANEPASNSSSRANETTLAKGMRRADGKKERRPMFGRG